MAIPVSLTHITNDNTNKRYNINISPPRSTRNIPRQFLRARLDRSRRGYRSRDDLDAFQGECFFDSAPVLDAGEIWTCETEFVETEEAVGEDDWVFGGG